MFLASLRISYSTFHGWVKTWLLWLILKLVLAWSRCTSFSTYSNERKWPKTSFKHTRCYFQTELPGTSLVWVLPLTWWCSPSWPSACCCPSPGQPPCTSSLPWPRQCVTNPTISSLQRQAGALLLTPRCVFRHCWQYEYCIMKIIFSSFLP